MVVGGNMPSRIKEQEFKEKAPHLFKESREKVHELEETEAVFNQILAILEESEKLFDRGDISESFEKYHLARRKIETVKRSHRAEPLVWRLFWIEIGYLAFLLLVGYLTYMHPTFVLWKGLVNMHLQTVWFGALGGVTAAIYGIYEHTHLRDFDPQYELWYICKPIIGGIFGWFVYLIYFIGLVSVQGLGDTKIHTPQVPYVIAFLAGFSERFTLKMIDKLMSVLTTWEGKDEEATSTSKKGATK